MRFPRSLTAATVVLLVQSCANNPHYIDRRKVVRDMTVISTPAYGQTTYIKPEASDLRYCAETNVDFAATKTGGLSTTFGYAGATDQIGDQASTGANDFGGRDPAVLMARELMFRACEFLANTNMSGEAAVTVYAGTLDAIVRISQSQQLTGTAPSVETVASTTSSAASEISTSTAASTPTSGTTATPANAYRGASSSFDWSRAFDYSESAVDTSHP